jgi:hypothetical protein
VKEFWRNVDNRKAIVNIGGAWAEVLMSCMNGVWKNIWPDIGIDFHDFNAEEEIGSSRHAIIDMARILSV